MKDYRLISIFFFFLSINLSSSTLMDGIITMSWSATQSPPLIDRFLNNHSRIQLKILCREPTTNASVTREQIKTKKYQLDKTIKDTTIQITGRIGRIIGCLPLQADVLSNGDKNTQNNILQSFYDQLWKRMEQRTFSASQIDCDYTGTHVNIDKYSDIQPPENTKNTKKVREVAEEHVGTLMTWADGYYIIEINQPVINIKAMSSPMVEVDVDLSIRNNHGGYLTADEYPLLVFYGVMCAIYALFAILWFVWCFLYWRELLKIQFYIGGVILIGMIEKSAFIAEYDTLNKSGSKVYYAMLFAEILSCLKRAMSRMLILIVVLGYGLVKPRLGPLKQKVLAMGFLYFAVATFEALFRVNSKHDETDNRVLISRVPLAIVDAIFYYWIFMGLITTIRQLRLKKNLVKLSVYRHLTNTLLFAIISSLLFMIWSLKSHFFTSCVTNWKEFWINDAFWHILFSLILLVIMFLFRPSKNNQRYAIVPLLDKSDSDDNVDDDDEITDSVVFDSITMRKATSMESGGLFKTKKQQPSINRESNTVDNDGIEDALAWVEDNIPTTIADQALQALDSEDEIVNTKLQRSKLQ